MPRTGVSSYVYLEMTKKPPLKGEFVCWRITLEYHKTGTMEGLWAELCQTPLREYSLGR